ncbi:methylated-DNA-[protein]-cysteine S-methyltransferase [Sanguibacter gelidistatuariae]|uniref:Methylated-DNA--protein-cysteine methyltransferase n=1 Tax=Sanguibacter gelidistatuariae TaxID=1814289 RepID=A0A1G6VPV1_9MICO|nr:methylated-DNA--[protein]-cysteine S-methyltransferase [Sanguibacter gelidistatuariae]SDD55463.1 methylated-DNA-[protein]-cysteine S-methyltransferase [Sanguibacter gelidistatuariae]
MKTYTVIDSPLGPLTAVATAAVLSGLYMQRAAHLPASFGEPVAGTLSDAAFDQLREELAEYFARARTEFTVATAASGTPFQTRVWRALAEIPYGQTRTYGQLAVELGDPRVVRAVGAANGRNPISIVVPCHRVIGADGALTGYAGGLERKELLLALEDPARARATPLF